MSFERVKLGEIVEKAECTPSPAGISLSYNAGLIHPPLRSAASRPPCGTVHT